MGQHLTFFKTDVKCSDLMGYTDWKNYGILVLIINSINK